MTRSLIPALWLAAMAAAPPAELTPMERQRLVAHLEMTASWLTDEVSRLSRAQLEFRRAPGTWNILEVLDHLVLVGEIYWDDLQRAVKAGPDRRASLNQDVDILWYGVDRTNREIAIPTEIPKGQVRDLQSGLAAYRQHHARLVEYVRTTKDDLRGRFVERQRCDAYQWALLISTHDQRHLLQIREIKADTKYPR